MMLARRTIKNVEALLKDGNYTRAAKVAMDLSDDPLVAMLALELASVGNKNRKGRGPRQADPKPTPPDAYRILAASLLYDDLIRAGKIAHDKPVKETVGATDITDEKSALALLRKHKMDKVAWQKFRALARSAAANEYGIEEEKIWR